MLDLKFINLEVLAEDCFNYPRPRFYQFSLLNKNTGKQRRLRSLHPNIGIIKSAHR